MNGKEYQSLAMRTNDGKATERLLDKYDMIDFFKQASYGRNNQVLSTGAGNSGSP